MLKRSLIVLIVAFFSVHSINASDKNFDKCLNDNLKTYKTIASKLEVLDCSNREITNIEGIEKYANLRMVNLNNNKLTNIPQSIKKLKKLQGLDLAGNVLYYVPNEINELKNLKVLNLNSTHLLELPKLDKLTKLEKLLVDNNQLFMLNNLDKLSINTLTTDNNFLNVNNVKTKRSNFTISNQKTLSLKNKQINLNNGLKLFTLQEELQRNIVDQNKRALNGVKMYLIVDVVDKDNKSVKLSDYVDINSGQVYQSGKLIGRVSLQLANSKVKTDLYVSLKTDKDDESVVIVDDPQPSNPNPSDNNIVDNKEVKETKDKEETKSIFETKKLDPNQGYKFLSFQNQYVIFIILLLITIIPVIFIIMLLARIKKYTDEAKNIGI